MLEAQVYCLCPQRHLAARPPSAAAVSRSCSPDPWTLQVLHSDVGQTLPWYFPLQPSYWHRGVAAPTAKHPLSTRGFPAQDGEVWPPINQPSTQFQHYAGRVQEFVGFVLSANPYPWPGEEQSGGLPLLALLDKQLCSNLLGNIVSSCLAEWQGLALMS